MNNTLTKIKILEKYSAIHENDEVVDSTISKLIDMKIKQLNQDIIELKNDLRKFEDKYHLNSEQFAEKYQNGEINDNLDFTDWIGLYKMLNNRIADISLLQGKE